jgi:hypothetical protein
MVTRAVVSAEQLDAVAREYLGAEYFELKAAALKRDGLTVPDDVAVIADEIRRQKRDRKPDAPQPASTSMIVRGTGNGYGAAALASECERVRNTRGGDRNNALNLAGFRMGQLVNRQLLTRADAERDLWAAVLVHKTSADGAEWDRHQAGTLKRGLEAGIIVGREDLPLPGDAHHQQANTATNTNTNTDVFPVIEFADLRPTRDAKDFVKGLLLDGGMSVVYGDSNTGKTFFAVDVALAVARGERWRDRRVKAGGVLYLALEGKDGIARRVEAYKQANNCNAADVPFAVIATSVDLCTASNDALKLVRTVKDLNARLPIPARLIVVDTLARALNGANENSSEDMGALVANCDLIRQVTGAHVLLIHHSGKDQARGARGHSSLRAATDTEIELARDEATGVSVATVTKQRDLKKGDTFGFTLDVIHLFNDDEGEPVTSCVCRSADAPPRAEKGHSPDAQLVLNIIRKLIDKDGATGFEGIPPKLPSIPRSDARDAFVKAKYPETSQEETNAKRQFDRWVKDLKARNKVGEHNKRLWLK